MKKAVHRLNQFEKWLADGQKVNESALSLERLFSEALEEERARLDARAVERALAVPLRAQAQAQTNVRSFESVP
jgi:hypothetical protein